MATSMGIPQEQAAKLSMSMTGLAGDLASFKNIGIDQAMTALNGVFTGETESLKQIGIVMTETNLDAYALANGFGKTTKEMTQSEKVMLRYQYVMSVTKNAQGDFSNTSDGTANSIRVFQESLKELGAELGQKLLPVITPVIQHLTDMVKKFSELNDGTQQAIIAIAGIAAVIGPLLIGLGAVAKGIGSIAGLIGTFSSATAAATAGTAGATAAAGGLGAALAGLAAPIAIAVAAVAAIGGVLAGAWQQSEKFRTSVVTGFAAIKTTCNAAFTEIAQAMAPVAQAFQQAFQQISATVIPILKQLGDFLAQYIIPVIVNFVTTLITGLAAIITAIAPFIAAIGNLLAVISNFVGMVFALLTGDWATAWEFAKNIGQSAVNFIVNIFQGLKNVIILIFTAISSFLKEIWQGIYNNTIGIVTQLATNVGTKWTEIKTDTQLKWEGIRADIAYKWESIKSNVSSAAQNVLDNVSSKWTGIKTDTQLKWAEIVTVITQKATEIRENVVNNVSEMVQVLPEKWEAIKQTAGEKWDQIRDRIIMAVQNLPGELYNIAVDMLTQMKNGIESTAADVWGAMTNLANTLLTRFKNALGIASPSKEMFSIGKYLTEGLINGLDGDAIVGFANNIVADLKNAFANGNLNLKAAIDFVGTGAAEFFKSLGIGGASFSGLTVPVGGPITSNFGPRDDVAGVGSSNHMGLDIGAPYGAAIGAAGAGTVTQAGWYGGYGNAVIINHGNGLETLYGHMSQVLVAVGDVVTQLQTIGLVGSTGNSTGPHLHFSVLKDGEFIDPSSIWGFDVGSRYIPQDMVAMVHKGEMIVPRAENPYANSGGQIMPSGAAIEQTVNIYSPQALSPGETARLNKRAMQELALSL